MKKTIRIIGTIALAAFLFASCGNSIESDAKKVAELQCEAQELMQKVMAGDASLMEESSKLAEKAAELSLEMEKKYDSASDRQKFAEALLKEMGNCGN
ncbi:hypothetical protein [Sunxiuqinia indica]|uniref:hypothetical protein n=1 Tax=Sunxiuqinia indica TaxID=2692584 RepID=UPI00135A29E8|nr:hypothetical protein [Sunxiuqinia indica]